MRPTRYYEKKNDGYFFAKAPKDYEPVEGDGTSMREWQFGSKTGETLGWKKTELSGRIESAFYKSFDGDDGLQEFFNIGLQTDDGVDVLSIKLYNGDTLGICQVLPSININNPITFGLKDGKPYTIKLPNGQEKVIQPKVLTVSQEGVKMSWQWPWDKEAKEFTGLPKPKTETKRGNRVINTDERDTVFYEAIQAFCDQVEIACSGMKDEREQTPAEKQFAEESKREEETEEIPF